MLTIRVVNMVVNIFGETQISQCRLSKLNTAYNERKQTVEGLSVGV